MLKKTVLLLLTVLVFLKLSAKEIDYSTALKVAQNFILEKAAQNTSLKVQPLDINILETRNINNSPLPALYIFEISDNGFIIIAGDDRVYPILGYSFNQKYKKENKPSPALSAWLKHYIEQITYLSNSSMGSPKEIEDIWNNYLDETTLKNDVKYNHVGPLLLTTWNQDNFYNAYCPEDPNGPGGRVYAGCVATAYGQVMKYYNYPSQGFGSHSYYDWDYGYQSASFSSTNYEWTQMPNSLNTYNNEVAQLLYHCGVAVEMGYSPYGSGAGSEDVVPALINYFGYSNAVNIKEKENYTEQQWVNMLKANLDGFMPLYYSGYTDEAGHAFVFDGYYDDVSGTHFHINWGWGGYGDGYFYVNNLASPGGSFNYWHQAIFNIIPAANYPENCTGTKIINGTVGTFEDGSGIYEYQNNTNCSWLIDPAVNIENIKLNFNRFDTEANNDILTIYNGDNTSSPVLGVYSGNNLPPSITSTAKKMLITFQTNGSVKAQGWSASYSTTKPVYCDNITIITEPAGSFNDGSDAYPYNASTNCRWRIEPPSVSNITLGFNEFNISATDAALEIYDVSSSPYTLLDTYSGNQIPSEKTYTSSKILLWFKTSAQMFDGWSAYYSSTPASVKNKNENDTFQVFPNPFSDFFNIQFNNSHLKEISIYTYTGQMIQHIKTVNKEEVISLNNFAHGMYLLKIVSDKTVYFSKIVKY